MAMLWKNHPRAIRILLATNGVILLAGYMLGPIQAIFVEKIGGDIFDASLASSIFALVAGILTLISGKFADKIKENELILVLGHLVVATGFFGYIFVSNVWQLFLVQVLVGTGEAIYYPVYDAIYSKHLRRHKEGVEWGAWEAMDYFANAIGAIVGGVLATILGFKVLFAIMSFMTFLAGLYIWRLDRKVL